MAKTTTLLALLLIVPLTFLSAVVDFTEVDKLYQIDAFDQTKAGLLLLKEQAANPQEEAEVLWRLARVYVELGDALPDSDKDGKYAIYEQGEAYALASIEKHPSPLAYLWKSSNIGRWGQTKGPLNALGKAKPMLEDLTEVVNTFNTLDSTETWYVLSSLYDELPGGFISFGNKEWAVSYIRMALDTIPSGKLNPGHYKKAAEELWDRNWSASRRAKDIKKMQEKWDKGGSNLEKYRYYEGKDGGATKPFYSSVTLDKMSDRQEALMIVSYAMQKAKVMSPLKPTDAKDIVEIQAIYDNWTK